MTDYSSGAPWPGPPPAERVRMAYQSRAGSDYIFEYWTALGWTVLTVGIYDLARQLGASRAVAVTVTVLITCRPATLLYENFLFYEYPVAVGLVVMAVALVRWVRSGRPLAFAAFAVTGAAIVLSAFGLDNSILSCTVQLT